MQYDEYGCFVKDCGNNVETNPTLAIFKQMNEKTKPVERYEAVVTVNDDPKTDSHLRLTDLTIEEVNFLIKLCTSKANRFDVIISRGWEIEV